ncbi:CobW family GTP-binding protein [Marivita sp.]|uniref:CobW family GTP-binding protein n=1 Tax=Marivita sp. TaxID=2003365 RepID=UPI003F6BE40E
MTPLPMTVISGYLGAGKTTFINQLLAANHGLKLMILVNDFGAINIDAALLASKDEDTIALTNGCVCCTMGSDLFLALGDALDRSPRPDHLIVEASGVADPARIANAAQAEPDMRYAGIVTLVDGQAFESLASDNLIGPQVRDQVSRADLVIISKQVSDQLETCLVELTDAPILRDPNVTAVLDLVLSDPVPVTVPERVAKHPDYTAWISEDVVGIEKAALQQALLGRPTGLFRVKGSVVDGAGAVWGVQVVGQNIDITPITGSSSPALVGIGPRARIDLAEVETWWASVAKFGH